MSLFEKDVFPKLIKKKKISLFNLEKWYPIDTREYIENVKKLLKKTKGIFMIKKRKFFDKYFKAINNKVSSIDHISLVKISKMMKKMKKSFKLFLLEMVEVHRWLVMWLLI